MQNRIAVITVCLNSDKTIEDCILSVDVQDYQDKQHMILDGGSQDTTVAIIKKHADKLAYYHSKPDKGIYDAMNQGIRIAMEKADIIGILNSDDMYDNHHVLSKVAAVFEDPMIEACYGDLLYVDKQDVNKIKRYWRSSNFRLGDFCRGWSPPHPTFFVRKSVYEKYGMFDLFYKMGNDIELMMRFLEKYKIKSVYIPETLIKMRLGGVSNNRFVNIIKQNYAIGQAAKKNQLQFSWVKFIIGKLFSRITQKIMRPST